MLEFRPQRFQVKAVYLIGKNHAVRIAHGEDRHIILRTAYCHRAVHKSWLRGNHRHASGIEAHVSHVHGNGIHLAVSEKQPQLFHAAGRLHRNVLILHIAPVAEVFAHAAYVVARHFALAAVPVEGAHLGVGSIGAFDEHYAVAADAGVSVAKAYAQRFRGGDAAVEVFNEYVIISAVLHFGKPDLPVGCAHVIYIHKLRIAGGEAALDHACQGVCGVKTGETRYAQLHCPQMQGRVVAHGGVLHGSGVDDIAEIPALHKLHDVVVFRGVGHGRDLNAHFCNGGGGARGGIELHADVEESF